MSDPRNVFAQLGNCRSIPLAEVPALPLSAFSSALEAGLASGLRASALFCVAGGTAGHGGAPDGTWLYALLSNDSEDRILAARCLVEGGSFPSMTPASPALHLFEREIAEDSGLVPEGHPWLKPVRYAKSRTGRDAWGRDPSAPIPPAVGDFYRVGGEEVHEVAVGPVHAGVIEPGHFRFQCHGEEVFHLEIALGYQHRGIERALEGGPGKLSLHLAETAAGDTTIGHATSYCQVLEALRGHRSSAHSHVVRGIALELERLANHTGDLGAISGDVGYLPTASFCGRIRGDFLNMTALLCGNRFGRGLVVPGGVGFDLDGARAEELSKRLKTAQREVTEAVSLLWDEQSVMARLEDTGIVDAAEAARIGVVGPAARASGLATDVRFNHPSGIYRYAQLPMSTCDSGDVFARAYVRFLEIQQSIAFIQERLRSLPARSETQPMAASAPLSLAVALNEGWRGEICHVAITDEAGAFSRYKIVDPSFHNWFALALALRGQEISDFPLCNKSFNLSYCGHDL